MARLIICKGLPASGKTTWAKELSRKDHFKRVNKDDLRAMLDDSLHSRRNERFIVQLRDQIIRQAFLDGFSVVSDDTNLRASHEKDMRRIAAKFNAEVQVKFFDVPLNECIRRDSLRAKPVGEDVIRDMYKRYLAHGKFKLENPLEDTAAVTPYAPKAGSRKAIMCDLDGTLCLLNGRNPYDASTCEQDAVNKAVLEVISEFYVKGYWIILCSGRPDTWKAETEAWLKANNVPYHELFMRAEGDSRKDSIIKGEIFDEHIRDNYDVLFVLDDRDQVVQHWRQLGLTVFQVADGAF